METPTMEINVLVTPDKYLIGAEDTAVYSSAFQRYWQHYYEGQGIERWRIPSRLFQSFHVHGTSEQFYSNGYTAYDTLRTFGRRINRV